MGSIPNQGHIGSAVTGRTISQRGWVNTDTKGLPRQAAPSWQIFKVEVDELGASWWSGEDVPAPGRGQVSPACAVPFPQADPSDHSAIQLFPHFPSCESSFKLVSKNKQNYVKKHLVNIQSPPESNPRAPAELAEPPSMQDETHLDLF